MKHWKQAPRSGQAAAELAVGTLLMVIVIFSLLFVSQMARSSLNLHAVLRGDAGERAMDSTLSTSPQPIADWDEGADNVRHTADDRPQNNSAGLSSTLVALTDFSVRTDDDWTHVTGKSRLPVSAVTLRVSPGLSATLGFVHAEGTLHVPVDPLVQQVIYAKEEVAIREEVWMPLMGGLY